MLSTMPNSNVSELRKRLIDNDQEALQVLSLAGVDSILIEKTRKKGNEAGKAPCPICGGNDRFSIIRASKNGGFYGYCRFCNRRYSPIDLLIEKEKLTLNEGVKKIVDYLDGNNTLDQPLQQGEKIMSLNKVESKENIERKTTTYYYNGFNGEKIAAIQRIEQFQNGERISKLFTFHIWKEGRYLPSKGFKKESLPPYNAEYINAANTVFIVEGEKDADIINSLYNYVDKIAVTLGGATNAKYWKRWAPYLKGKQIYILGDNDAAGIEAVYEITKILVQELEEPVYYRVIDVKPNGESAPEKYDVGDYLSELDEAEKKAAFEKIEFKTQELLPENWDAIEARSKREKERDEARIYKEITLDTEPFPIEAAPRYIRDYCAAIANKYHLDPAALVLPAFAYIGGFIGTKFYFCDRIIGEERLAPTFAFLGVAKSGSGKTPIYKTFLKPINNIQEKVFTEYHKENIKHKNNILRNIAPAVDEPIKYFIAPATAEAVGVRLGKNERYNNNGERIAQNGLTVTTDEAAPLFIASSIERSLQEFNQYSKIFDGDFLTRETVTTKNAGELFTAGEKTAAFVLFTQPDALQRLFKNPLLKNQGFINRFISVYFTGSCESPKQIEILEELENNYNKIFDVLYTAEGFNEVKINDEARTTFFQWRDNQVKEKFDARQNDDNNKVAFLSKLEKFLLSTALIIQVVKKIEKENLDNGANLSNLIIDVETIIEAIRIANSAKEYTFACWGILSIEEEKQAEIGLSKLHNKVFTLIEKGGEKGVTESEIQRISALRGAENSLGYKKRQAILKDLTQWGLVKIFKKRYYKANLEETK